MNLLEAGWCGSPVIAAGSQYNVSDAVGFRLFTKIVTYKDDGYTGAVGGTTLIGGIQVLMIAV